MKKNCKAGVSAEETPETVPVSKRPHNQVEGKRTGWNYNEIKTGFISSPKKNGFNHRDAVAERDESDEKRALLGSLSLPELKKRRFVEKSCEKNPWA